MTYLLRNQNIAVPVETHICGKSFVRRSGIMSRHMVWMHYRL